MTIEVFKTNIENAEAVTTVTNSLNKLCPAWKVNVDLQDCDNILRIESAEMINTNIVREHLLLLGYFAELLL